MAGRRLNYEQAARLIIEADPLTEVRVTLGWSTSDGTKRPVLKLSSRSVVNYKAKAKPLGTIPAPAEVGHAAMVTALGLMMTELLESRSMVNSG